ncbi:MAG: CCA tRNA nucleotidyltransferase [Phycisphaerales bacterium]|nr:CCA tRNA nucleotidyltransferase [Phycisphaerales bacterium]
MAEDRSVARRPMSAATRSAARDVAEWIVRSLRDSGHIAYFAGGCVRDRLLGNEPNDYDVATDAPPTTVRRIFPGARSVGESFGVILVRRRGITVEVATFRREWGYSDSRRPDVVEFTDAAEDARRRDFTVNALFEDPIQREVIDYVGGLADLDAGILRAVGNPMERLEEDHLRALRAVRFTTRLGFSLDERTADAIRVCARSLRGVSRERIGQEMRMSLTGPDRVGAVRLLHQLHLDAPVLRESAWDGPLPMLESLDPHAGYPVVLAAWMFDRHATWDVRRAAVESQHVVSAWRRALALSNDERDHLKALLRDLVLVEAEWDQISIAGRKRLAAADHFDDLLVLLGARDPQRSGAVQRDVEALAASGLAPPPLLDGDDLIALGFEPGPIFTRLLDAVYDAQLEGRIHQRDEAVSLARELAQDEAR